MKKTNKKEKEMSFNFILTNLHTKVVNPFELEKDSEKDLRIKIWELRIIIDN